MENDILKQAQMANIRAIGMEAARMQIALEFGKLGYANYLNLFGHTNAHEPEALERISRGAVSAADALMAALRERG